MIRYWLGYIAFSIVGVIVLVFTYTHQCNVDDQRIDFIDCGFKAETMDEVKKCKEVYLKWGMNEEQ